MRTGVASGPLPLRLFGSTSVELTGVLRLRSGFAVRSRPLLRLTARLLPRNKVGLDTPVSHTSATRYNFQRMSASDSIPPNAAPADSARGRLKVFLGYASGVGKSFRMFDEARRRKERGQDVVVGALQPQVPAEIEPILSSLEIVPTIDLEGVPVIDVPAILRRHPQVCLVDGLAYDNPWNGNAHRWQDVEELLAHGINVVGSVNLQHIADQREAAEKLTGRPVS